MHHDRPQHESRPCKRSFKSRCHLARVGADSGPIQSNHSSIERRAEVLTDLRRNGKEQNPVTHELHLPRESWECWVGEQGSLQLEVCRPDSLHLIQRLGSSDQAAGFMIHKLRTVKIVSALTQEGPQ